MTNKFPGRKFNWISGADNSKADLLNELDINMSSFYSDHSKRELYQHMLEEDEDLQPDKRSVRYQLPLYIFESGLPDVLEIGCSNGKLYRLLKKMGFSGNYTGIDLPDYIITKNKINHPECNWYKGNTYKMPFKNNSFDIVFSLYVLEHLVYPEKALIEQMRVTKLNGKIVLVFPDFVSSGRLGSQQLGYSPGTFKTKIKKGRLLDALISLYDSRIRLPNELKKAVLKYGKFPINISPICLRRPEYISADVDATYLASKTEIIQWAVQQGHKIELPCGEEGEFKDQSFVVIQKNNE